MKGVTHQKDKKVKFKNNLYIIKCASVINLSLKKSKDKKIGPRHRLKRFPVFPNRLFTRNKIKICKPRSRVILHMDKPFLKS